MFNDNSKFEDFLTSFYLLDTIFKRTPFDFEDTFSSNLYHLLSLFKIVFTKYAKLKYSNEINVNLHIQKLYEEEKTEIILKTFKFINEYIEKEFKLNEDEKSFDKFISFMTSASQYERVKGQLEDVEITTDLIENVELKDSDEVIEIQKEEIEEPSEE